MRTPNKNLDVKTKSFWLRPILNQFDDSDAADIKRKISQRKLHNVLMTYMQELPKVFFARKCFNLLTSKHAQRWSAEVHASLPVVNIWGTTCQLTRSLVSSHQVTSLLTMFKGQFGTNNITKTESPRDTTSVGGTNNITKHRQSKGHNVSRWCVNNYHPPTTESTMTQSSRLFSRLPSPLVQVQWPLTH